MNGVHVLCVCVVALREGGGVAGQEGRRCALCPAMKRMRVSNSSNGKRVSRLSGGPGFPLLGGSWYQSPVAIHYEFELTFPNVCQGVLSSGLVVVGV